MAAKPALVLREPRFRHGMTCVASSLIPSLADLPDRGRAWVKRDVTIFHIHPRFGIGRDRLRQCLKKPWFELEEVFVTGTELLVEIAPPDSSTLVEVM